MFATRQSPAAALAAARSARRPPPARIAPALGPSNSRLLQRKLAVGRTDDLLEREADRVAERALRSPPPEPGVSAAPLQVSRACAACDDDAVLRPKAGGGLAEGEGSAPPLVHEVLSSPGRPLSPDVRGDFEGRFGRDFGAVRVHDDAQAAESARQVGALAYTVGSDVVFSPGVYAPRAESGRRLLAHELAHVAQQDAGALRRMPPKPGSPPPKVAKGARRIDYGSTPLSQEALVIRRQDRTQSGNLNLVVASVEYTKKSDPGGAPVHDFIHVYNDPGIAHSEEMLDQAIRDQESQYGIRIEVTGIFSERQFCGPSSGHNCQRQINERYPDAEKEFAFNYQQEKIGREKGDRTERNVVAERIETFRDSKLDVDTSTRGDPPPFNEVVGARVPSGTPQGGAKPSTDKAPEPPKRANFEPPTPAAGDEAAKAEKTERPTVADVGVPPEPVMEGGPTAEGTALEGGVIVGAQLKDWIMDQLGQRAQGRRLSEAWNRRVAYMNGLQQQHPELGLYVTIYWRVRHGNEGETTRTFEDISIKQGPTEKLARESPEPSALNLSAGPGETETSTQWIAPPKPLGVADYPTPYPKIAVATFAPGRAELRDVSWGGPWGGAFNQKGLTSLEVPAGLTPRFAILSPPTEIYAENQRVEIETELEATAGGHGVPVISDLNAAMVFALDVPTIKLLAKGRQIGDTTGQLQGDFDLLRWVPVEDVQVETVLSDEVKRPAPKPMTRPQPRDPYLDSWAANHGGKSGQGAAKTVEDDVLRFSSTGKPVSTPALIAWARRNHPRGEADPGMLKDLYASHEFSGSKAAREGAAIDLVLALREGQKKP